MSYSLRGSRANSLGPLYGLEKASTFINSLRVLEEKIFSFKGDLKTKQKTSFSICDVRTVEDKTCNNWSGFSLALLYIGLKGKSSPKNLELLKTPRALWLTSITHYCVFLNLSGIY